MAERGAGTRARSGPSAAGCRDLVKTYWAANARVDALRGASASFHAGSLNAVMGPSGSGKSTLLRVLSGLEQVSAGEAWIGDVELSRLPDRARRKLRRDHVGYVFQRPSDNFVSYLTVSEHLQITGRVDRGRTEAILGRLGLGGRGDHRPHELSGGEQQRAALAQVLAANPSLIVADEPTAELDEASGQSVLEGLRAVADRGACVVVATHDARAAAVSDEVWDIHEGRLVRQTSETDWMKPNVQERP